MDAHDVVLIGGGIMSATLGSMLQQLEPDWKICVVERLDSFAQESSDPWNNAGTGHSALCELNYTPETADGGVDITSAVKVNEQFQLSRQFWSFLVESGQIPDPKAFVNPTPHMSYVWGAKNVEYLRKRYDGLREHPLFAGMEYSEDPEVIRGWAPSLIDGRTSSEPVAATYSPAGTDVDFGSLTRILTRSLVENGAEVRTSTEVRGLKRDPEGGWIVTARDRAKGEKLTLKARFVFVGAGGGALTLLQKSGIDEIRGFGGFPVSGEFLRTRKPEVVATHAAKVYGKAAVGAPPMSVPHLDTRVVDGTPSLMFGPYAGFSPRFLKKGSLFDLLRSVRLHNLVPMLQVAFRNFDLVRYLLGQLFARKSTKFDELRAFMPAADPADWEKITAGQRVQVIKKDPEKGGILQFGTEVVAARDGSIAGLLGASPGASTTVAIMLDLMSRCFPDRIEDWQPTLEKMVPSFGHPLATEPDAAAEHFARTARALRLDEPRADRASA
ncbi:malate:quinone oxidoreductase [Nocardioides zeae]|uniref:Probable malate:quinone oxidoreductase n=1 Tax=Nocardioides imazamoxiresistens TaxID=3231893 RepID=A0ABU3Q1P6_9ACTN|nr:malate:quinone oxidoreductase [Nocardioides zeae]MDT9595264.1 malate:quinone oxidoreductase [Nocardioides zeae]